MTTVTRDTRDTKVTTIMSMVKRVIIITKAIRVTMTNTVDTRSITIMMMGIITSTIMAKRVTKAMGIMKKVTIIKGTQLKGIMASISTTSSRKRNTSMIIITTEATMSITEDIMRSMDTKREVSSIRDTSMVDIIITNMVKRDIMKKEDTTTTIKAIMTKVVITIIIITTMIMERRVVMRTISTGVSRRDTNKSSIPIISLFKSLSKFVLL